MVSILAAYLSAQLLTMGREEENFGSMHGACVFKILYIERPIRILVSRLVQLFVAHTVRAKCSMLHVVLTTPMTD